MRGMGAVFGLFFLPALLFFRRLNYLRYDLQAALCLVAVIGCLLIAGLKRETIVLPRATSLLLLSFLILVWLSVVLTPLPSHSLMPALQWLIAAICFLYFRNLGALPEVRHRTIRALGAFGVLAGMFFCANLFVFYTGLFKPFGFNRNYLAHVLLLPFFLLLFDREKFVQNREVSYFTFGFVLFCIVLTRSRAAWIAIGLTLVLQLFGEQSRAKGTAARKLLLFSAVLLLIYAIAELVSNALGVPGPTEVLKTFADPLRGSAGGRIRRWLNALVLLKENFLFGFGPGNWARGYANYSSVIVPEASGYQGAYNSFLELAGEVGVPALIVFLWFVYSTCRQPATERPGPLHLTICALLLMSFFHLSFSIPLILFYLFSLLGLLQPGYITFSAPASSRIKASALFACTVMICFPFALCLRGQLFSYLVFSHVEYLGRSAFVLSENTLGITSRNLVSIMPGLDYRNVPPLSLEYAQFASRRFSSVYSVLAREEQAVGNSKQAVFWARNFARAFPDTVAADKLLCEVSTEHKIALSYCQKAYQRNPKYEGLLPLFAELLLQGQDYEQARLVFTKHLEAAKAKSEWLPAGSAGSDVRFHLMQDVRSVIERLAVLDDMKSLAPLTGVQRDILAVPLVHKRITGDKERSYISTNSSGQFNLSMLENRSLELLTHDPLTYFQPTMYSPEQLLGFVSDRKGDRSYRVFVRDLQQGKNFPVTRLGTRVRETSVSSDGRLIFVITRHTGRYSLREFDLSTHRWRLLRESASPIRDVRFIPGGFVSFVENESTLVVYNLHTQTEAHRWQSQKPLFNPSCISESVWQCAAGTGDGAERARLVVLRGTDEQKFDAYVLDPIWLTPEFLLYREKQHARYLLKKLILSERQATVLWKGSGVVYPVHIVPENKVVRFLYADEQVPLSIVELNPFTGKGEEVYSFTTSVPPIPHRDDSMSIAGVQYSAFTYEPPSLSSSSLQGAIVWLHGSSSSFSPRWHQYAQFFAQSGYVFTALNYESEDADDRSSSSDARAAAVALLGKISARYGLAKKSISLLSISSGASLARRLVNSSPHLIHSLVEYSPVTDVPFGSRMVPTLSFLGENDRSARRLPFSSSPARLHHYRVLPGEGHDVRSAEMLEYRLRKTLDFLQHRQKN